MRNIKVLPIMLAPLMMIAHRMTADQWAEARALGYPEDPDELCARRFCMGHVGIVVDFDGEPVIASGVDIVVNGVASTWVMHNENLPKHIIDVTRVARRWLDEWWRMPEIRRIETRSLASRTHAHHWYHALGFKQEYCSKSAGCNGEDFLMFARVRGQENTMKEAA